MDVRFRCWFCLQVSEVRAPNPPIKVARDLFNTHPLHDWTVHWFSDGRFYVLFSANKDLHVHLFLLYKCLTYWWLLRTEKTKYKTSLTVSQKKRKYITTLRHCLLLRSRTEIWVHTKYTCTIYKEWYRMLSFRSLTSLVCLLLALYVVFGDTN